jgi:alpha-beta hydrolase superfamily lysophospholipase
VGTLSFVAVFKRTGGSWVMALALSGLTACAPSPAQVTAQPLRDHASSPSATAPLPLRFELANGHNLAGRVWPHTQARHIVLGVHGFNDYSKAFESLAQHLRAELGATVYAYDQRGFGANLEPGIWPGTDALLADLRHISAQLRMQHPGLPLTVVGESMGGALVWVAASEAPGLVADQVVLKAPAVWGANSMPWYQKWSLQFLNAVAPDMTFTGRGVQSLGITPTNDPEVSRDLSRDPLFIKATRVSSLAGVTSLMGRAQGLSDGPAQRSLVLYGLRDRIIPPAPVCDWLTHLNTSGAARNTLDFAIYPEGWHLLTRQLQTHQVLLDLAQWMVQNPISTKANSQQAQESVCAKRS